MGSITGSPYCVWLQTDYLLWWLKPNHYPPLLTTGPAGPGEGGILGHTGTLVLAGGNLDPQGHSGGRITGGWWVTDYRDFGVQLSVFCLDSNSNTITAASNGGPSSPVLSRPFFNVLTGQEDAAIEAYPGLASGSSNIATYGECTGSSRLFGTEANVVGNWWSNLTSRVEFLVGYRYLSLEDHFRMRTNAVLNPLDVGHSGTAAISPIDPTNIWCAATHFHCHTVFDEFNSSNRFSGGQIGANLEWQRNRLTVQMLSKLAVGVTTQTVDISGHTILYTPGAAPNLVGAGFLAVSSNIGRQRCEKFTLIPEVDLKFGYKVTDWLKVFVGYDFLYWSTVARTGAQVPHSINVTEVPALVGAANLAVVPRVPRINSTAFWVHGLNLGLELRY